MCGGEPPTDGDPDGSVTEWFLCPCCSKITSVVTGRQGSVTSVRTG